MRREKGGGRAVIPSGSEGSEDVAGVLPVVWIAMAPRFLPPNTGTALDPPSFLIHPGQRTERFANVAVAD